MINYDDLTWECDVCGETRPNAKISVFSRDLSDKFDLPPETVFEHIKFCNDSKKCRKGAKDVHYIEITDELIAEEQERYKKEQ